jgi:protein-S-isoprenylcysteine O-methyltransferase Ste14
MKLIQFRPPRIAMMLAAVAALLYVAFPAWNVYRITFPFAGALLFVCGFAIMMSGWLVFRKSDVAICPLAKTQRLVTHGIYRFTRNPMYLGMMFMMTGMALCIGTLPFYLAAAVFFCIINAVFCPFEEAKLTDLFGQEYIEYRSHVRRWF